MGGALDRETKGFCSWGNDRVYLVLRELAHPDEKGALTIESILEDPDKYVLLHEESSFQTTESKRSLSLPEPDRDPRELENMYESAQMAGHETPEDLGPSDILPLSMRRKLEEIVPIDEDDSPEKRRRKELERTLKKYHREGLIVFEDGTVSVTDKGARVLARGVLKRILGNFKPNLNGKNKPAALKEGFIPTVTTRKYESGDDYASLDVESSLLNALGRGETIGAITFRTDDFRVREMTRENKLIAGLLVDTSMSMQMKGVMATARDTSLALAELIGENPNHILKVYLFADHVKETPPRDIFRNTFPGGLTDICAPLEKFRERVRLLEGEKQAYLITDSVSNVVNGRRVGFEDAAPRVLEEASRYRKEKITLNIVMLGEQEQFRHFCLKLAQRSMGRAFFVSSDSMTQTIVRDYFRFS
ncbi:MAG: hypothetical protein HY788_09365 [Deltaproteobacteria bacterium]|nr:hypothetical protein [Deltaproteobacteria bacterium]